MFTGAQPQWSCLQSCPLSHQPLLPAPTTSTHTHTQAAAAPSVSAFLRISFFCVKVKNNIHTVLTCCSFYFLLLGSLPAHRDHPHFGDSCTVLPCLLITLNQTLTLPRSEAGHQASVFSPLVFPVCFSLLSVCVAALQALVPGLALLLCT